jgi:pimeloyl-ACP methyl ester carboxylesterase
MISIRLLTVLVLSSLVSACNTFVSTAPRVEQRRELLNNGAAQVDVIVNSRFGKTDPAIVLLPSSQRDSEDFDELAHLLATEGFRVLRPQPRGMGRSSAPPKEMSLHTLASDVAVSIERLGNGRAVVVGHAYGHWTARVTDMNHPQLVRGVVVLGGSAKVFPAGMAEALALGSDTSKPEADRVKALEFSMFAPGNDARVWLSGWHPHLRAAYRSAGQIPSKDTWFNSANAPILDLQGDQDAWRPASSRNELKELLGNKVTVSLIPNAGHAMIPEQPKAIAAALVKWIGTLSP